MLKNIRNWPPTDKEKLLLILKSSKLTRSELAKALEVDYKSIYRWLDQEIQPRPRQSRDIDVLFKDHVDLRPLLVSMKKKITTPIQHLKSDEALRNRILMKTT